MERKFRTVLLLGTFINQSSGSSKEYFALTKSGKVFDMNLKGSLTTSLISDGPYTGEQKIKVFHFSDPTVLQYVKKYDRIATVNLGPLSIPEGVENVGVKIENIIGGVVYAIRYLKTCHFDTIFIDSCDHPKIVGTAVALILPIVNTVKGNKENNISIHYFDDFHFGGRSEYQKGLQLGKGQVIAQQLMKCASISEFIKTTKSFLGEFDVDVVERTYSWIREKKMSALLSVSRKSQERPVILEMKYNTNKSIKLLILVGKATPYESSLFPLNDKPELHQFQYRSGMGGASCIVGSLYTLCKIQAPVAVHCIVAVVWNELHDKPNKIGDVVRTMNGTSIQIDRPEAEGRLVMADVLCYANTLNSSGIMDVTSLSSNVDELIGNSYIAFFSSDAHLKQILQAASQASGEKVWNLPLFKVFRDLLKTSVFADLSNVGENEKSVTACKSAMFLREFVSENTPWIHLDISPVCECKGKRNYILDWATGRSTRLVSEFCLQYFKSIDIH